MWLLYFVMSNDGINPFAMEDVQIWCNIKKWSFICEKYILYLRGIEENYEETWRNNLENNDWGVK